MDGSRGGYFEKRRLPNSYHMKSRNVAKSPVIADQHGAERQSRGSNPEVVIAEVVPLQLKAAAGRAIEVPGGRGDRLNDEGAEDRARFGLKIRTPFSGGQPLQAVADFAAHDGAGHDRARLLRQPSLDLGIIRHEGADDVRVEKIESCANGSIAGAGRLPAAMARWRSATSSSLRCGAASMAAITANGSPARPGKGVTSTKGPLRQVGALLQNDHAILHAPVQTHRSTSSAILAEPSRRRHAAGESGESGSPQVSAGDLPSAPRTPRCI